eukprot:6551805-Karenia_brevis.AAC.1
MGTEERIKRNGKLARLCYHPDKAERALEKEGVEIIQDVQDRVNTRFRFINQASTILSNAKANAEVERLMAEEMHRIDNKPMGAYLQPAPTL